MATNRKEHDAYYTDPKLAQAICKRLKESILPITGVDVVIEPSAGEGAFVNAAYCELATNAKIPSIIAIEPYYNGEPFHADLFLKERWEDVKLNISSAHKHLVLGNPPFNLPGDGKRDRPSTAERHVLLALERIPNGSYVAFLLRSSFHAGKGRIERLHSKHNLRALWPVTPRPSFSEDGKTDMAEYSVFVWEKGYEGLTDTTPLVWK